MSRSSGALVTGKREGGKRKEGKGYEGEDESLQLMTGGRESQLPQRRTHCPGSWQLAAGDEGEVSSK